MLVPSPKVATYDLQPEMSCPELTAKLCEDIRARRHDVIVCNIANPDMVGHTGSLAAAIAGRRSGRRRARRDRAPRWPKSAAR